MEALRDRRLRGLLGRRLRLLERHDLGRDRRMVAQPRRRLARLVLGPGRRLGDLLLRDRVLLGLGGGRHRAAELVGDARRGRLRGLLGLPVGRLRGLVLGPRRIDVPLLHGRTQRLLLALERRLLRRRPERAGRLRSRLLVLSTARAGVRRHVLRNHILPRSPRRGVALGGARLLAHRATGLRLVGHDGRATVVGGVDDRARRRSVGDRRPLGRGALRRRRRGRRPPAPPDQKHDQRDHDDRDDQPAPPLHVDPPYQASVRDQPYRAAPRASHAPRAPVGV